jgi:hypothetical protein
MTEFKTGVRVLIPGTIVNAVGSGGFIVKTAFGNTIVERFADLQLAEPREGSIEERIERLARVMARADDVDPNERATIAMPLARAGGFLTGDAHFPAWRLYVKYAQAVIDGGMA